MSRAPLKVVPPLTVPSPEGVRETWPRGRVRTVNGVETWYIRKRVGGEQREFAVADNEDDALAEWALFSRNPLAYQTPRQRATTDTTAGKGSSGAVRLDSLTLDAFFEFCQAKVDRDELSTSHLEGTLKPYLKAWAKLLRGRDLHTVPLDDLQAALRRKWTTARHKRTVALKSFSNWARTEKATPKLRRESDPTLDLKVPPVVAEKAVRRKGYTTAFVEAFYPHVASQVARDMLRLRAFGNGMHDTEIDRIARGKGELLRVNDPSGIAGVAVFHQRKKDEKHSISLDAEAFAAAERLQARGGALSTKDYHAELHKASIALHGCKGVLKAVGKPGLKGQKYVTLPCAKCKRLQPNELRHSFGTWAATVGEEVKPKGRKGVPLDKVAELMGHKSKRTTSIFYIGDHVPNMVKNPLTLTHPDDPRPTVPRRGKRGRSNPRGESTAR